MDDIAITHGGAGFVPTSALMLELRQRQIVALGARIAKLEGMNSTMPAGATPAPGGQPEGALGQARSNHRTHPCVDFDTIDSMCVGSGGVTVPRMMGTRHLQRTTQPTPTRACNQEMEPCAADC